MENELELEDVLGYPPQSVPPAIIEYLKKYEVGEEILEGLTGGGKESFSKFLRRNYGDNVKIGDRIDWEPPDLWSKERVCRYVLEYKGKKIGEYVVWCSEEDGVMFSSYTGFLPNPGIKGFRGDFIFVHRHSDHLLPEDSERRESLLKRAGFDPPFP